MFLSPEVSTYDQRRHCPTMTLVFWTIEIADIFRIINHDTACECHVLCQRKTVQKGHDRISCRHRRIAEPLSQDVSRNALQMGKAGLSNTTEKHHFIATY